MNKQAYLKLMSCKRPLRKTAAQTQESWLQWLNDKFKTVSRSAAVPFWTGELLSTGRQLPYKFEDRLKNIDTTKPFNVNFFFPGALQAGHEIFNNILQASTDPYFMYRHSQLPQALDQYKKIRAKYPNARFTVIGHSMGTRPATGFPGASMTYLLDPVHPRGLHNIKDGTKLWTAYPENTSVLSKDNSTQNSWNNLIAWVGGRRRPKTQEGHSITWKGDHFNGAPDILADLMNYRKDLQQALKQGKIGQKEYWDSYYRIPKK